MHFNASSPESTTGGIIRHAVFLGNPLSSPTGFIELNSFIEVNLLNGNTYAILNI